MPLDSKKELTPIHYSAYAAKIIYHTRFNAGAMTFPLHWHERLELLRILEGSLIFSYSDHQLTLQPGDVCLVSPRMLHSGVAGPQGVLYDVLMFDLELLCNQTEAGQKYLSPLYQGNYLFEPLVQNELILQRLDAIVAAHKQETDLHPLQVIGQLYDLVGLLYKNCVIRDLAALPSQKQFGAVIDYINDHYTEDISSASLSRQFGHDEAYFCRKFKKHTGLTIMKYIQILRIEKARKLLTETEQSVQDIAVICGFADSAYFNKCFKNVYRITPTQMRQRTREGTFSFSDRTGVPPESKRHEPR